MRAPPPHRPHARRGARTHSIIDGMHSLLDGFSLPVPLIECLIVMEESPSTLTPDPEANEAEVELVFHLACPDEAERGPARDGPRRTLRLCGHAGRLTFRALCALGPAPLPAFSRVPVMC